MNDPATTLHPLLLRALVAALVLLLVVVGARTLQSLVATRIEDRDARYRMRKLIGALGYVAALFALAVVFSDQLGGLTVAFGVAGAGIAFALQEVIASVAGWLAVSFGGFFRVGDRVQLGGIRGDVIDIGIIRTTLLECGEWMNGDTYTGRVVRIANSFVFKEPVFNYSGDFPFLWDEIRVPIRYGSDLTATRDLLARVAREVTGEEAERVAAAWQAIVQRYRVEDVPLDPTVTIVANDNWVEFTVRYAVDYRGRRSTKDRLFTRVLEEIAALDGRVAMASATFALTEAPALDVRLSRARAPAGSGASGQG